jgi:hypothetical protein
MHVGLGGTCEDERSEESAIRPLIHTCCTHTHSRSEESATLREESSASVALREESSASVALREESSASVAFREESTTRGKTLGE